MSLLHRNGSLLEKLQKNPDYSYHEINPYVKEALKYKDILYSGEELINKFPEIFINQNEIIIELGCYMGHTLLDLSMNNKNLNFLGIDIRYKRVVKTAKKIVKSETDNTKVALVEGRYLLNNLPENSIIGLCIFFPDPWNDNKKHRMLNEYFFKNAFRILKKGGFIWIKTDDKDYYQEFTKLIKSFNLDIENNTPSIIYKKNYPTIFEKMFISLDTDIYEVISYKK